MKARGRQVGSQFCIIAHGRLERRSCTIDCSDLLSGWNERCYWLSATFFIFSRDVQGVRKLSCCFSVNRAPLGTLPGKMAANVTALYNDDWNTVLQNIDPTAFALVGAALALVLCVVGAAW